MTDKEQGIVRHKVEEQPVDKDRAQTAPKSDDQHRPMQKPQKSD